MSQLQRYVGPSARHFEDFKLGERIVSQGRTITQADGLLWAMYTGDMNPMHVDHEFAAKHALYGGAFPPGLMAVAIAQGLKERLGLAAGTGLAILEHTIRYKAAVLFGDTIHLELVVTGLKRHATKPRGTVHYSYQIMKGDGTVAVEGEWVWLFVARQG